MSSKKSNYNKNKPNNRNNNQKNPVIEQKPMPKTKKFIILSFVLAAIITLITYAVRGIYPFGDNIILKVDLYHQYGPFHEELRSRILNGQSLLYSWEGGLGKEFLTQLAYYTASPLSIFILLFKQDNMAEAMAIFILIKIALASSFFAYYLKQTFKKNDLTIVMFGLMYAFCSYITGYYWNVMWLDAVALFPIVALGLDKLVKEDKHKMYTITLTLIILMNFYIAFLVCVFAVLYFTVVLFVNYDYKKNSKLIWQKVLKFAICSALAGGISMILTIPTAMGLSYTAASDSSFPSLKIYQNVWQLITNHFMGARSVVLGRNEDLPNVYTGVLTLVLAPMFFFNKKVSDKEKWLYGAFIVFMLLCCCVNTLDYLIHGAHFPSNLPHRFTFIHSFIILVLAFRAFITLENKRETTFSTIYWVAVVLVSIMLITEFIIVPLYSEIDNVLSELDILLNLIAVPVYLVLLANYVSKPDSQSIIIKIMLCLIFAECLFGSISNLDRTTVRVKYVQYTDAANEAVDYMDELEDGKFYRAEFRRFTSINDSTLYHYNGFSQFSSMAYGGISALIEDLGIAATSNSYRYYDPTSLVDAMFGIKYVLNKDSEIAHAPRYELLENFDNVWVYRNDRVLPLGYMVDSDIKQWDTDEKRPFDVQNEFVYQTTDVETPMFEELDISSFNYANLDITDDSEKDVYKYKLHNEADLNLIPTVNATIHVDEGKYVYFYVDAGNAKRVVYTANGKTEDRELSAGRSLFDVGYVSDNSDVTIKFELTNKGEFEKTYRKDGTVKIFAASYDDDAFQEAFDALNDETLDITSFEDTHIIGTVNPAKDGVLMTSIPYEPGWSVFIDGVEAEVVPIGNEGLIGVDVAAGEHTIEFKYMPKGFIPGIIITLISLILYIIYAKKTYAKFEKKEEEEAVAEA